MVTGCLGIADNYQVFDFRKVETALGIESDKPGMLSYWDSRAYAWSALPDDEPREKLLQYGFCQGGYYVKNPVSDAAYDTRLDTTDETITMPDAAMGYKKDDADYIRSNAEVTDASGYEIHYTFGDPLFKPYDLQESGDRAGFYDSVSLLLVSKEPCEVGTDLEPFIYSFELHCVQSSNGTASQFRWWGPAWPGKTAYLEE
jgi:hypothetical protein